MFNDCDALVVGAGPTGAAAARELADGGLKVLVVDRRNQVAGNCYDYYHGGVLTHRYGPHYFHTNDSELVKWLSRFTEWIYNPPYHVKTFVFGQLRTLPLNPWSVSNGPTIKGQQDIDIVDRKHIIDGMLFGYDDILVNDHVQYLGRKIGKEYYQGYTLKQWGAISGLDIDLLVSRIPLRGVDDPRYFVDRYQQMPHDGYTAMFKRILDHGNIRVLLQTDARELDWGQFSDVVYTGPLDEYHGYKYGELNYRTVDFMFKAMDYIQDTALPCVQINYPNDYDFTRQVEIKHVTGQRCHGTVVVEEYPRDWSSVRDGDEGRFYPIPYREGHPEYIRARDYRKEEVGTSHTLVGRLAQYEYLNMDEAFRRGRKAAKGIIHNRKGRNNESGQR
jgi:UDP-galactopyranose mutase